MSPPSQPPPMVPTPQDGGSRPPAPRVAPYGNAAKWSPQVPQFRLAELFSLWLVTTLAVFGAAAIVPGVTVRSFSHAAVDALLIGVLNAVITPFVAALRLPFTLGLGFVTVLLLDGLILLVASDIDSRSIKVSSFGAALLAGLVISALVVVLRAILGSNDDDTWSPTSGSSSPPPRPS
jgi:putative membrane protein